MTDLSRARIENRAYPVLRGPGPVLSLMLALTGTFLGFATQPTAGMFLMLAGLLFMATAATTLRIRADARRGDFVILAVLASLCLAWAFMVYFRFGAFSQSLHLLVLTSGALVLGLARYLRCYRYAWNAATEAALACDCDTLANYAEFLLEARPGPAAPQIAREFYRLASEEILYYLEPTPRHTGIIKRYIDIVRTGVGGPADPSEAQWWHDRVAELEGGAPCPPVTRLGKEVLDPVAGIPALAGGDGALRLVRGRPVWRLQVDDPAPALAGPVSIGFHPFAMREGAVVACILCLHGHPAGPVVRYRAFDVWDAAAEAYLAALEHRLSWRLELSAEGRANRPGAGGKKHSRTISLTGSGLMEAVEIALVHNRDLRTEPNGAAALARFSAAIEDAAVESGLLSAWSSLEANGIQE